MNENCIRIGAINWDAALPKNTYFGGYALRNLGTDKYCQKLPYFAQKTENGWVEFATSWDHDEMAEISPEFASRFSMTSVQP